MNKTYLNRCRACAELKTFPEKMVSLYKQSLSDVFTDCTSLKVTSDDSLPSHICIDCFGQLSNLNHFRQTCINSDAYFREQILSELIKVEQLDEIGLKCEESDANQEIKCEIFESDCNDDSFTQFNSESIVQSPVASNELPNPTDRLIPFDNTKYFCDYCGQGFERKSSLGSHMVKHKMKTQRKSQPQTFTCTVQGCSKVFDTKRLFNSHSLKVHEIKPEPRRKEKKVKLNCSKCPKWFTVQRKLDAHVRSFHEGLKPNVCPEKDCAREFCKYQSYEYHVSFSHPSSQTTLAKKEFRCTYDGCGREYGLIDSLNAHVKRSHLGIIPVRRDQKLICDQCGRSFIDGYTLKKHIYTHSGKLPFACKTCPKKFSTKSELKIHTMRHQKVKPFKCPTCGVSKTTKKELEYHLNFHSKEISYPCKECPRVFTSYGAISRHVRIHHRNHKPYICPHCQRAFAKAETMKNHVMTHTGEKPFACPVCGHRFIQGVALKTHMKTHAKK